MINYRANRAGTTLAAYRGEVRVGYVTKSDLTWGWELNLLRPTGGHYVGIVETSEAACTALESSFKDWMFHANLREKT
jgi:hypothetical protein